MTQLPALLDVKLAVDIGKDVFYPADGEVHARRRLRAGRAENYAAGHMIFLRRQDGGDVVLGEFVVKAQPVFKGTASKAGHGLQILRIALRYQPLQQSAERADSVGKGHDKAAG